MKVKSPIQISKYSNAKIMPFGVFSALLIQQSELMLYSKEYKTDKDFYFSGLCSISLEEIIDSSNLDICKAFLGLWLLSSIVRYDSLKRQEIFSGTKDTIMKKILDFNRYTIPNIIMDLVFPYVPLETSSYI